MKVADVVRYIEQEVAPPAIADPGDRIGLQVGDTDADVRRIVVAVDPTPEAVAHAAQSGATLLITHHTLVFRPLERVLAGNPVVERVMKLITSGTSLYVMHTNYDSAPGGINDALAARLGVTPSGILTVRSRERRLKLVVFTPQDSLNEVLGAMTAAGAGVIGSYSHCSFRTPGTGTFVPLPGGQPTVGKVGSLEETDELRLEMIVPEWKLDEVVAAMSEAHPYEEVAYDVYALENEPTAYGYGRIGTLDTPLTLKELMARCRERLGCEAIRWIGDPAKTIRTVALCGGMAAKLIPEAKAAGADVLVCGDLTHHDLLDADAIGLAAIDSGHYETERPGMEVLVERLRSKLAGAGVQVEFLP